MEGFFSVFTIELFNSGIRLATPILLAALGGALCNKAGVLNLALESKMLLGAFLGIVAAYYFGNTYLGILVAVIAGGLLGWLFAFLYHRYQVDLVILAIALNLIILELTVYIMRVLFGQTGSWSDPSIVRVPDIHIPIIQDIPVIGGLLSGYNFFVYLSWAIAITLYVVLYHTTFGRHIRAVGENKEAAETVGINARRIQTLALVLSGMLAALGGAFLSVGHLKLFTRNMSNGRGWTAIAAALFGLNHPIGTFFASLFFGFADAFSVRIQNVTDLPPNLVEILPNFATVLVLVLIALRETVTRSMARSRSRAQIRAAADEKPGPA
ncbi:MAG TPA: ABC transporter permease [Anaerolineales bacterium]|nr:ABC transporter permease [Anaerolineales bacterium]HRF46232.1 ABC transporter permease [Anaerolineales bacterium]